MGSDHFHRICTYKEAESAIRAHNVFYANDCFCRAPARDGQSKYEYCGCPVDVCMGFHKPGEDSHFPYKEINLDEAIARFNGWREIGNIFRFMENEDWICFCCKCGCGFFRDEQGNFAKDSCEKAPFIEQTDAEKCTLCGLCIDICAYDARSIKGNQMIIDTPNCYGCSACEFACPEDAITMAPRTDA